MGLGHSPQIVTNGMVLCLDAANPKNFNLTEVEVLVVAGGGSGGVDNGGGGGAGGLIYNRNFAVTPGSALTVTVGAGGAARSGASDDGPGNNGDNSVFGALTAYGGGAGSGWTNTTLPPGSSSYTGGNGAGQSASTSAGNSLGAGIGNRVTGTTTVASGQGNNGGTAVGGFAGGGGGAGGPGGNASSGAAGAGGLGYRSAISGVETVYAAGGAGGWDVYSGYSSSIPFTENGTVKKTTQTAEDACPANTGHGGNGGNHNNNSSGAGGSGIVIVRYPGPQKAIGGTVTSVAGHTIHTFTTVGSATFTPLVATNNSAILGLSDFSGNNNFGTTVNSPTYSSANGGSVSFDGTDDYVTLSSSQIAPGTNAFTWNFWVKLNDLANFSIVFSGTGSNTDYGVIFMDPRNGTGGLGYYALGTRISDNNTTFGSNWWCITFVGSGGANGSRNLKLYRNAIQAGSTYTFDYNFTSTTPNIGANHSSYAELMRGNISNVSHYNRALTAAEISQNFNALRGRFEI